MQSLCTPLSAQAFANMHNGDIVSLFQGMQCLHKSLDAQARTRAVECCSDPALLLQLTQRATLLGCIDCTVTYQCVVI